MKPIMLAIFVTLMNTCLFAQSFPYSISNDWRILEEKARVVIPTMGSYIVTIHVNTYLANIPNKFADPIEVMCGNKSVVIMPGSTYSCLKPDGLSVMLKISSNRFHNGSDGNLKYSILRDQNLFSWLYYKMMIYFYGITN